jgi:hypothetical protein
MKQPPLLPEETFARVLRLARFDGMGALGLGSLFAVMAAGTHDVPFAVIGLLAAGAGAVELHGVSLLRGGEERGLHWLIASQPFLLLVVWSYCGLRLVHFEMPPLPEGLGHLAALSAEQWGLTVDQYFRLLNTLTVAILALVSLCYQASMAVYYFRRRGPVARALAEEQ